MKLIKSRSVISIALAMSLAAGCSQSEPSVSAPVAEAMVKPQVAGLANGSVKVDIYQDYLNRDVRDDMFYFVLPDRFNNANPENDNGSKTIAISSGGLDVTSKWAFHGGDMQGIEEKLDYLQGLGITAIWMTPILRNRAIQEDGFGHHGYWILDFTQIDPHFGSNDDLKSLIAAAHNKGIKIFFDIITNHTADVIKYEECHLPDGSYRPETNKTCKYKSLEQVAKGDSYTPFIPKGEENLKTPAWLNDPKYYHNQGDSFWQGESSVNGDFVGLDDLKTEHPDVVAGMIDIYRDIITEFKPDGFRIDTVKHVNIEFWQAFTPAIMAHAKKEGIPNFHVFGEVYDGSPEVLSRYTTEGKMPAVLDFGFQGAAAEVFYQGKSPQVIKRLFDNDDYFNDADSQADLLLNFLGNHDMGRSGFFINRALPNISAEEKLQRSILSHAFMYLSRGIPVVYYGDEQGFTGDGGDVDAREDMFPSKVASYNDNVLLGTTQTTADDNFNPQHPIYQSISEFAKLRKDHVALRRGININRYFDDHSQAFAFSRVDADERIEYLIAFNAGTTKQSITLAATADKYQALTEHAGLQAKQGIVTFELAPLSFAVFKAEAPVKAGDFSGITLADISTKNNRVSVNYKLTGSDALALYQVKTEYKNAQGEFVVAATDNTLPYSAILLESELKAAGATQIRVTADNLNGKVLTKTFSLK